MPSSGLNRANIMRLEGSISNNPSAKQTKKPKPVNIMKMCFDQMKLPKGEENIFNFLEFLMKNKITVVFPDLAEVCKKNKKIFDTEQVTYQFLYDWRGKVEDLDFPKENVHSLVNQFIANKFLARLFKIIIENDNDHEADLPMSFSQALYEAEGEYNTLTALYNIPVGMGKSSSLLFVLSFYSEFKDEMIIYSVNQRTCVNCERPINNSRSGSVVHCIGSECKFCEGEDFHHIFCYNCTKKFPINFSLISTIHQLPHKRESNEYIKEQETGKKFFFYFGHVESMKKLLHYLVKMNRYIDLTFGDEVDFFIKNNQLHYIDEHYKDDLEKINHRSMVILGLSGSLKEV
eukprot:Pgem_evm1s4799